MADTENPDVDLKDKSDQDTFLKRYGVTGALTLADQEMIEQQKRENKELQDITRRHLQEQQQGIEKMRMMQAPPEPKQQPIPKAPQEKFQNPFDAFQSPAVLLATLGSLFSRRPLTAAFTAAASAMEGFHKGDKEAIDRNVENWKNHVDEALKQNKQELEAYNRAWERYHNDFAKMQAEMQAQAAGFKDEVMMAQLKYAGPKEIYELIQHRVEATNRLEASKLDVEKKRAEIDKLHTQNEMIKSGGLDEETIREMAQQARAGDTSVFTNLGRGVQGARNIERLRAEITRQNQEEGTTGAQQAATNAEFQGLRAGERTAATRSVNVQMFANEANSMADLALQASRAVPRTNWVPLTKAQQMYQSGTSSPELARFVAANLSFINTYAKAVAGGGQATVSDKDHARDMISTAMGPAAYEAVIAQLKLEMEAALRAPKEVKEGLRQGMTGQPTAPKPGAAPVATPPAPTGAAHMSDEELARTLGLPPPAPKTAAPPPPPPEQFEYQGAQTP